MLLIKPGLKEVVEAKLPPGNESQPDRDTGKLVAQALFTETQSAAETAVFQDGKI